MPELETINFVNSEIVTVLKAAGGYFAARESSVTDDPNTQLTRFNVHKNCLDGSIPINV